MQQLTEVEECYCAEIIGNYLYVAAKCKQKFVICCYDIIYNTWSTLPPIPSSSSIQIGSLCHIEDHLYVIYKSFAPCRYNIATNQWHSVASSKAVCNLGLETSCSKAAAVYKSCLYVLYLPSLISGIDASCAHLYCFNPKENVREQKASTKTPHFKSSLLVVKNNLYVARGHCSFFCLNPREDTAATEVYNDQENAWSVVQPTHIPPNDLGAVEIDGRVYFIINSFPVDSGITTPPGDAFPAILIEWKKLGNVDKNAVLCYNEGVATNVVIQ